jgi:hypothetical protein
MTIALVSLNMFMGAFLLLNWSSLGTDGRQPVLYGIGGIDLLFLYFIAYYGGKIEVKRRILQSIPLSRDTRSVVREVSPTPEVTLGKILQGAR